MTDPYSAYVRARDAVLRMKARPAVVDARLRPSAYWSEELEMIDYLIEASPLIVRKLRYHTLHITGVRPYDYRSRGDERLDLFTARLNALRSLGGDELLVPESPLLGGFGYEIDGRLFNVDTLKFYEVLIGLRQSGALDALRGGSRPVVCEIGAGWGGFAYQFKTLFPDSTLVLVDLPELFLFSATYLGALFPDARLAFGVDEVAAGCKTADFVFLPNTDAALLGSLPLDLTLNMVSFQEMTESQVRAYAAHAARARCPWLYSLNRERSQYNSELASVSETLGEYYQLTEIPLLETDYASVWKRPARAAGSGRDPSAYRHQAGKLIEDGGSGVRDRGSVGIRNRSEFRETAGKPIPDPRSPIPESAHPAPRFVLGMTLHNNAAHLPEALDSLLAQTRSDFTLVLLDDASTDATERIARAYAGRDPRVRYFKHAERRAMIATWREVAELAARECPSAEYFAWVSDHDRWHARWLERMSDALDGDPGAVLAYPITRRMAESGEESTKGPRLFDSAGIADRQARWTRFCHEGVGAGDMVYGLVRLAALRRAGTFRRVLRPDRLLVAELILQGSVLQVPEVLWFRRLGSATSVQRQRASLVLPGEGGFAFRLPASVQHGLALWAAYARPAAPPLPISRARWVVMLLRYQATYAWRHQRKTAVSHAIGRALGDGQKASNVVRRATRHLVDRMRVGGRLWWAVVRRASKRAIYHALVLLHRVGLRRPNERSSN